MRNVAAGLGIFKEVLDDIIHEKNNAGLRRPGLSKDDLWAKMRSIFAADKQAQRQAWKEYHPPKIDTQEDAD
jgi:hypothetical protein